MRIKHSALALIVVLLGLTIAPLRASGPLGIYGIVEKVVFEPDEKSPERIQVWGAFAYVDGNASSGAISTVARGYLYFRLPDQPGFSGAARDVAAIKTEWSDLKAVAGTGQAIGFGRWGYIALFSRLQPDKPPVAPSFIYHDVPTGGGHSDLRVRPASEPPASPATYQTNAGIVKLSAQGSHAAVVKALQDAPMR